MIIKGSTDPNELDLFFQLTSSADNVTPINNQVFTLGWVTVKTPGMAPVAVDTANIFFDENGAYRARLTPAQAGTAGKVLLVANVPGANVWTSFEDVLDPATFANGGAGGGNGGPLAASGFRTWTLAQLQAAVQHRGAYERSNDITLALIAEFLNEAIAELWDLIVEKWADYYTISTTFPFVAGTDSYQLPGGFYKLRKVELQWDSTPTWCRMETHDLAIAHEFVNVSNRRYSYRLQAGYLVFVPVPATAETIRIYYIPCAPVLVGSADAIDGINGYEELVIQLSLKRCKDREELDTSTIDREIARLTARIRTAADGRDATEPFYLDERRGRRGRGSRDGDLPPGWGY